MERLTQLRKAIDQLDAQLLALYEARMDVCRDVAAYKREQDLPVLQPDRERALLKRVDERVHNRDYAPGAQKLFESLMAASRALQATSIAQDAPAPQAQSESSKPSDPAHPLVGYPGAPGAFSQQAVRAFFGPGADTRAYKQFEMVIDALKRGEVDVAVLPIENSSAGSVDESHRLIVEYGLNIAGERILSVRQHLLGAPGATLEDVREIRSHPQAIAQSHGFLLKYPQTRIVPCENTALAAQAVRDANDVTLAAIASLDAARTYGLTVLKEDIQDAAQNQTRFVLLTREAIDVPDADKASLHFVLADQVGSLKQVLDAFARQGINMSHLSSRPCPDTPWSYAFYADLDWSSGREALIAALGDARPCTRALTLLGLYKRAKEATPCQPLD